MAASSAIVFDSSLSGELTSPESASLMRERSTRESEWANEYLSSACLMAAGVRCADVGEILV